MTTDWRTRIWIKDSMNTSPEEWKSMVDLKESYVWIDYVSMPQPTAVLRAVSYTHLRAHETQ